ncbi:MAG: hypothetical protein PHU93_04940, partial [Candidatus Gracilibacteria bacterium]|nr:hypothetical protein [Candidatus Gracilibacteria bacterium]
MKNALLNDEFCPVPDPKARDFQKNQKPTLESEKKGFIDQIREKLNQLRQEILGKSSEATDIQKQSRLNLDNLRIKNLPPHIQKHLLARQEIMDACIDMVGLDETIALVEDPRGNTFSVSLDFTTKFPTTHPKQEIRQVRKVPSGHELTFDSIGGKNGYNTEYRITAKKGKVVESWTVLAVKFGKMSNEYYQKLSELEKNARLIQKEIDAVVAEVASKKLKIKELTHERTLLQNKLHPTVKPNKITSKNPQAKKSANTESKVDFEKRVKAIDLQLPELRAQVYRYEKELPPLLVSQKTNQLQVDQLPKKPGMIDNAAYIPFANLREGDSSTKSVQAREKLASEVEKFGLLSLKESVTRSWTNSDIQKTETSLKNKNGKNLSLRESFPIQTGIVLAIVERMGFVEYAKEYNAETRKGKLKSMEEIRPIMDSQIIRALNNLGMNQEGAFNHTRSKAGARGIAQMMPQAHRDFVNKYGVNENGLLGQKHFDSRYMYASTSQPDSLRFMLVHLYDEARYLPLEIRENWQALLSNPKTRTGILGLLAAGYNGDIGRVKTEVGIPSGLGSMREALKFTDNPKRKGKFSKTYTKAISEGQEVSPEAILRQLEHRL